MIEVSVVMPTYNCAKFLAEAIDSVKMQTNPNWELIIVDDGSTDETLSIAKDRMAGDRRVRIMFHEHCGKPAIIRNFGIREVRGKFVTFLDGDDLYSPDRIKTIGDIFRKHSDLDFIFHDVYIADENGQPQGDSYLVRNDYLNRARHHLSDQGDNLYFCKNSFYAFMSTEIAGTLMNGVTLRKDLLMKQSEWFPEDVILMEDYDLWFRLVKESRCAFFNAPLSTYRRHGASVSSHTDQFAFDQYKIHRRNLERARPYLNREQLKLYRNRVASMQENIGYMHLLSGRMHAARSAYLESLAITPQTNAFLGFIKSFLPKPLLCWLRNIRSVGE